MAKTKVENQEEVKETETTEVENQEDKEFKDLSVAEWEEVLQATQGIKCKCIQNCGSFKEWEIYNLSPRMFAEHRDLVEVIE